MPKRSNRTETGQGEFPFGARDEMPHSDVAERPAVILPAGVTLLSEFAREPAANLLSELSRIESQAPFRNMFTPGGLRMSVAMSNCGEVGWVSDRAGYRYQALDPETGRHWPKMPRSFYELAARAATAAGFVGFEPDVCLINRYEPGTRLSLHQDLNERDYSAPIVSVSLGLPATFLFGGMTRAVRPVAIPLQHGDVVVWGGAMRLAYHGVRPIPAGSHSSTGACRINLTFRRAR